MLIGLSGCDAFGSASPSGAKRRELPLVTVVRPRPHVFVDRIDAVGTARANEQVTLSAPVSERIERLYFEDGAFVRRGQIVALLSQRQEQASLASATAASAEATAQLRRIRALNARGFATGTLLDQQTAQADRARSDAENVRAQIADRVVRAPFSGDVALRTISEGSVVAVGAPIATISDLSRIKLDFPVPETALASLRAGQPIRATAAAFPAAPIAGRIATIDTLIDPATRAATIRALLPNPGKRLKPGMLLSVSIESASRHALAVPELAVLGEADERYVFVVGIEDKARRVPVTTGLRDDGLIEVRGLPADARVIGEGVVKVSEGTKVQIDRAPASRDRRS